MTVVPLGECAVLVYLADEAAAVRFAAAAGAANPAWLTDVVPAYASVGVYFDPARTTTAAVAEWCKTVRGGPKVGPPGTLHTIPVCYEMQLDLARVADATGLSADDVIRLHLSVEYAVYAIGFVPGFPYLGYLPPELSGVARLPSPRVRVEPGSVGLTGRQTGIYPLARPGGWNLIGRTPVTIVDPAAGYFPIRVGDRVRFARIDAAAFARMSCERV